MEYESYINIVLFLSQIVFYDIAYKIIFWNHDHFSPDPAALRKGDMRGK